MPDAKQAPGCSEAGILGPVAGLIGTLQALETGNHFGQPTTLTGRLLPIEGLVRFYRNSDHGSP